MKKYILDLRVVSNEHPRAGYSLLKLTNPDGPLPEILPGQFVQLAVTDSPATMLRRPISVHHVDYDSNQLWLLIHIVGDGTKKLGSLHEGDTVNTIVPLGKGFTLTDDAAARPLLVGGGVGIAPLLYFGAKLKAQGVEPTFLLGARSKDDLLQLDEFEKYGRVFLTTEDGSIGEKGFVTQHSIWNQEVFTSIHCCGPKPMMVAVAKVAKAKGVECEVSLENMMACGLGACLCCVEDTQEGNVCVCKEGPVFNINELKWQI